MFPQFVRNQRSGKGDGKGGYGKKGHSDSYDGKGSGKGSGKGYGKGDGKGEYGKKGYSDSYDGKGDGKQEFLAKSTSSNPVARAGSADEVASGILFALTNDFVTGTVIDVDGGAAVP